jgi:hypothetical protein
MRTHRLLERFGVGQLDQRIIDEEAALVQREGRVADTRVRADHPQRIADGDQ